MDFLIGLVVVAAIFVWPIWFLVTMNSMKSSLLAIQRELRLQGDWLEVIATNDFFAQVPSSESTAGQEAVEDYWCPNCRDKFEADIGSVGQCPKCKRIGHLYES